MGSNEISVEEGVEGIKVGGNNSGTNCQGGVDRKTLLPSIIVPMS